MASLREYCEKLPTGTLEDFVFGNSSEYTPQVILTICQILLEREPNRLDVLKVMWDITDRE